MGFEFAMTLCMVAGAAEGANMLFIVDIERVQEEV
jgi:hypothetical protein